MMLLKENKYVVLLCVKHVFGSPFGTTYTFINSLQLYVSIINT